MLASSAIAMQTLTLIVLSSETEFIAIIEYIPTEASVSSSTIAHLFLQSKELNQCVIRLAALLTVF